MDDYTDAEASLYGVRMAGTVTVVPANVVYYEDYFDAIEWSDENAETEGNKDPNLKQSADQDGVYGYDDVYFYDENGDATRDSGGSSKKLLQRNWI